MRSDLYYIPIAKTGSGSVRDLLRVPKPHHICVGDALRDDRERWEAAAVRFATIRHPYDRVVSWCASSKDRDEPSRFVSRLAAMAPGSLEYYLIRMPQVCWLTPGGCRVENRGGDPNGPIMVDQLIRLDGSFSQSLADLVGCRPEDVPHDHRAVKPKHGLGSKGKAIVRRLYAVDFERLGYSP